MHWKVEKPFKKDTKRRKNREEAFFSIWISFTQISNWRNKIYNVNQCCVYHVFLSVSFVPLKDQYMNLTIESNMSIKVFLSFVYSGSSWNYVLWWFNILVFFVVPLLTWHRASVFCGWFKRSSHFSRALRH